MNFIGLHHIFASPEICTIIKTYTRPGNSQLVFAEEKYLNIVCVFSCSNHQQSSSENGKSQKVRVQTTSQMFLHATE